MREQFTNLLARFQGDAPTDNKFGTLAGVFVPTTLTILGVIMYLRLGQVVGNAGLLGAIIIILLAHVITISTGLSVSSVATNTRVGAGGAFAIISRSLGLEVGGSVGIPLYLAQAVSITLYVFGFSEVFISIFPALPFAIVSLAAYALLFAIAYISAQFASRIQLFILAIVGFSIFSIFMGAFPIAGQAGFTQAPVIWGAFDKWTFWQSFAIFFPAVTGIMVGISMSGELRDPRRSIPQGTMGSIALTLVIYLGLTYWLARIAPPEELLENTTIMVDRSIIGWTVLAGMLGATFSSALGSLIAAPRVMQALAERRILPYSNLWTQLGANGEPRNALFVTGFIGLAALMVAIPAGGLDVIAPIITMFFLITYTMLNVVVVIEQGLSTVSFRPSLKVSRLIPIIGLGSCLFVMFLVNALFGLVSVVLVLLLYGYLGSRKLDPHTSDVRSGLFMTLAEWAAIKSSDMPSAPERTWKPSVLAPVTQSPELVGSFRFLRAVTAPQGAIHIMGVQQPGANSDSLAELEQLASAFKEIGIYSRVAVLDEENFVNGVRLATQILQSIFFRPNILFLHLRPDSDLDSLQELVDKTAAYRMGIILLARHPIIELGREQLINVWISDPGNDWQIDLQHSNQDLSILLAYQLARNWQGRINLCMAVPNSETVARAASYLEELIDLARLPASTQAFVREAPFTEAISQVPRADINIFGLPRPAKLIFCQNIVASLEGSCIFVRDSGLENALV